MRPAPPQALRPCELPFREKAQDLAPQTGMEQDLDGPGISALWKSDAAQYNALKPKFNENIEHADAKCVARPAEVPKAEAPKPFWKVW